MLGGNLGSLLYGDVSVMLNRGEIPQCMSIYGEIHLDRGKNNSLYVNILLI